MLFRANIPKHESGWTQVHFVKNCAENVPKRTASNMIDLFWVYLVCFVTMIAGLPATEWCEKRKLRGLRTFILSVTLIASVVIFIKGAFMVPDWSNPFAGNFAELPRAVHSPKGWFVVAIISVWPYFLMGLSGLAALAAAAALLFL
jgi:hypothetical protein